VCGIAGILHLADGIAAPDAVAAMTRTLAHRGPDGQGIYANGPIALGHRRLAIIDLDTGQQPMSSSDGTLVLSFNGEIYNYVELKRELERAGRTFRTSSDTEVLIAAYEAWGLDCLERLNGMWAVALWDPRERRLVLSRDRLGEKPLFYALHGETLIFASEIKALLAYGVPVRPRLDLLEIYLTLGYIPAPHTFYDGIHKLRAGHVLVASGGQISERRYWSVPIRDEAAFHTDVASIEEQFASTLDDAVRIRMRSDVPFGAFLSGGLDSGSIVSLMSRHSSHPVQTFTIGFAERAFDERTAAREIAAELGTHHHEYAVDVGSYEEAMERILHHYDEPFGDSSAIPTGYLCQFARQHVKMALTGDGGDEALSGYTTYQGEAFSAGYRKLPAIFQRGLPRAVRALSARFTGRPRYALNRVERVFRTATTSFESRLAAKLAYTDTSSIRRIAGHLGTKVWPFEELLSDTLADCPYNDPFYRLMWFHLHVSLPDDMLVKVDRMSMAFALETRMPFLDHRIIELMSVTDRRVKMPHFQRKAILRNTAARALPRSALRRAKRGFVVPLRDWLRGDVVSQQRERQTSLASTLGIPQNELLALVDENAAGTADHGNFLWMLDVLGRWLGA